VGSGAAPIADGAAGAGMSRDAIVRVDDRSTAAAELVATLRDGDVVLVKASRGVALDLLVDELVASLAEASATPDGTPRR
jgi:UDP-N-acetylmuramoyl-tripeptide--D-alanyl-D-alanine ligase